MRRNAPPRSRETRKNRVAQALRSGLAEMLQREVKDPRVHAAGVVSVSHVELNRDMSVARVYVTFYTDDSAAVAHAMQGVEAAAGFLRGPLARRCNLARAPELRFVHDTSPDLWERLDELAHEQSQVAADQDDEPGD